MKSCIGLLDTSVCVCVCDNGISQIRSISHVRSGHPGGRGGPGGQVIATLQPVTNTLIKNKKLDDLKAKKLT